MRNGAQIVRVAFTYIGTVVGAGFASGQEILQFFTRYGSLATLTIALSTMLFIWIGIQLMLMAHDLKAESYEDLNKVLFGEKIGKWISLFMMVVLFGITTVMLAGAGTVFEEQLHLSYTTGLLITLVLSYVDFNTRNQSHYDRKLHRCSHHADLQPHHCRLHLAFTSVWQLAANHKR